MIFNLLLIFSLFLFDTFQLFFDILFDLKVKNVTNINKIKSYFLINNLDLL
jgi:hypothetical protein